MRAIKQVIVNVRIIFLNGSELYIREYIDARFKIERVSYAYHYQDNDGNCIFRYDNAVHRPALGFKEHKHTKGGNIVAYELPSISEIFKEISENLF